VGEPMAIFKSIVAGLLALLLALPSPALCYADVVADEGANHAQEAQEAGQRNAEEQEDNQESAQQSNEGQRSDSDESSRSSSGDGAALSASSDGIQEEGLENGDLVNNAAVRSNGFDPSGYPLQYSDPSFNSYLGYARDDLQEAIKQFYDLSESRELSDDENEQATLALFAWYYLDYGSTDDLVQAAVSSDWILSQILGSFAFSTKDLFYGIWYMFYGTPSSWGATPPYDTYSRKGLVWYVVNIDSKLTAVNSHLSNIYNRLGGIYDRQATIINNLGNLYDRLGGIYDRIGSLIESNGTNLTLIYNRLAGIYDRQGTSINGFTDIYSRVNNLDQNLVHVFNRLGGIYDRAGTIIEFLTSLNSLVDNINVSLVAVYNTLFDSTTKRPWLQVIGDRLTAFMYQIDASQAQILLKLDTVAKDDTVTSGFNNLDTHILLYLFGNNNGLPAYTEFLDNGLIYYIVQIHDDNKAFFDAALELLEYMKDRLFYIEYDLVDYGMDIEPGFNRVIEAINTKQFEIQLGNAEVSINLSGVESRLDTIITILGIAGAKDLLETFLGDFNFDASSALAAAISSAMQNVFPFCIPAILKQCLGLMQAEAHAPVFEFDIFGAPLVLDFTAQGLCDISQVTSWFCRISFLILLLVNTKKFIFTINNRGAQDG
jgi:hypothetical protein